MDSTIENISENTIDEAVSVDNAVDETIVAGTTDPPEECDENTEEMFEDEYQSCTITEIVSNDDLEAAEKASTCKNGENQVAIRDKPTRSVHNTLRSDSEQKIYKKEPAPPQKIVIRRLPPTMSADAFLRQVSPLPEYNNFYFVKADKSYSPNNFARAYINFVHTEDIFMFKEKFDNYVFVDAKGNEFTAVVEFAIFQCIPKRGRYGRKKDNKCGTIESDPAYMRFIEEYNQNPENTEGKPEYSFQLKDDTKKHDFVSTPLVEYVNHRKQEQNRIREEKREERRQREANRRRLKDEERRRKRIAARERDFYKESQSKRVSESSKQEVEIVDDDKSLDSKTESEESLSRTVDLNKSSSKSDELNSKEPSKDRTDSVTFIRTRRESFDSDRSDRSRPTYGSGRFERKSKYESYSSARSETRSSYKSSFNKEPYKPRFPQSEKGRKDIYSREERFAREANSSQRRDRGAKFESATYSTRSSFSSKSARDKKSSDSAHKSPARNKIGSKASWKKNRDQSPNSENRKPSVEDTPNGDDEKIKSSKKETPEKKERSEQETQTQNDASPSDRSKKRAKKPDDSANSNEAHEDGAKSADDKEKDDPRKQRRIRNKDRPALQIYRPGMGRFSKERKTQIENEVQNKSTSTGDD